MTEHASLRPETYTTGGLIDDIDVSFKKLRFVEWDYGGKISSQALALCLEMEDAEGEDHIQYFSAGDLKNWQPSEDGKRLVRSGAATTLNDSTNMSQLISSIINAGYPENKLDEDVSAFEGMYCHVLRKAQPKRTGLIKPSEGESENNREKTILLVTEIHKLPWEKKGKKSKASTKTKAKAAPAEDTADEDEDTGDLDTKASGIVEEVLLEVGGGPISKVDLAKALFKKLAKDKDRNKIVQLVHTEEFLTAGSWAYDGSAISLEA